ncbi:RNA N(6)-adenosine-methyltransferase METTL16 isoform X6 [Castor canadensis]|uniref:RNA N(6)-adenosine-methyltransferase METTL16 isoform X6 n=1 Tax=Castor canadensis TaxID=51338 RepID=A0AC58KCW9_CASCN
MRPMALSKSMHARNRYKDKPPDFAYLASKYPDFKQHVQINLNGRVSLNFKDPEAVRALTCTLLREDFGLSIDIPLERLIPTVPLRLNYIHWVEDLIGHQDSDRSTLRRGIDIDFLCLGIKTESIKEKQQIGLYKKGVNSRNPRRPPPSSVNTGGITEIMAEGGELEFVKRIIHDSLQLKKRLRWYSCMLGKKCSLAPLKEELRIQGVPKVTFTEFCQGRTMRWALAWSFYDDVTVPSPPSKRRKLEKPRKPITFVVLKSVMKELSLKASSLGSETVEGIIVVTTWIEKILTDLKVQHKRVPCGKEEVSLFLTAIENSWIHLRRKKRERVRQLREVPRAPEDVIQALEEKKATPKELENSQVVAQGSQENALCGPALPEDQSATVGSQESLSQEETPEPMEDERNDEKGGMESVESCKGSSNGAQDQEASEHFSNPVAEKGKHLQGVAGHYLFKCLINVKKEVDDALVEMHWVEGQNRDLMNQLCTYIRNQIFRLVAS